MYCPRNQTETRRSSSSSTSTDSSFAISGVHHCFETMQSESTIDEVNASQSPGLQ